jgi:hypothetical protein
MDEAPALERLTRSAFYREGATVRLLVRWIVRGPAGACELYVTHDLSISESGVLALMSPWTTIPREAQVHVHSYAERAWTAAARRDDCDLLGGSCYFDARHAYGKTLLIGALNADDPDVFIFAALESLYGDDLEVRKDDVEAENARLREALKAADALADRWEVIDDKAGDFGRANELVAYRQARAKVRRSC